MEDAQTRDFRPVHQLELRLCDRHKSALGADDEPRHVEAHSAHELIQIVAGDPPLDLGVAGDDLVPVGLPYLEQPAVDVPLETVRPHHRLDLRAVERSEPRGAAVGQHHVQLVDVIDSLAPHDRVSAAGVVAQCAADVPPVGSGRVGREQ